MEDPRELAGDGLAGTAAECDDLGVPDRLPQLPSQRVIADLRRRIEAGEWQPGEQLPPVGALAEHYAVARRTVTKALRQLSDDGLLTVLPNWGTFRAGEPPA
jgi:DNA-binding GntR family transcriptional regulator